ncbi:potassium channel family protein [Roseovarius sp. EL26]|uniref:potassium channel family protein n=1 Tax=Roseovarius sp. EL26 TaxID=2126672 RepID=UPI000EA37C3F|nr:potassium channel family protein [Roseovarius sp. EL26]
MKATSPFVILISSLVIIVSSATVFFHYLEGWSWIDSYFFTVVTLSTVGYGNLVPETEVGKIAASILIFTGIGIFALTIQSFASLTVKRRLRKSRDHRRKLAQNKQNKEGKDSESS